MSWQAASRMKNDRKDDSSDEVAAFTMSLGGERLLIFSVPLEEVAEHGLTPSESEVAQAVCQGLSNHEIAQRRQTSVRTVANQLASIYEKLEVHSRAELVVKLGGSHVP